MTKLVFHIQGSAPEPYSVIIERTGTNHRALCDCQSARVGNPCRHRLGLFKGDAAGVVGGDVGRVSEVKTLLEGTDVESALAEVKRAEIDEAAAKKRLDAAKKAVEIAKRALGRTMAD